MKKEFRIEQTGNLFTVYRRSFWILWDYFASFPSLYEAEMGIRRKLLQETIARNNAEDEKRRKKFARKKEARKTTFIKYYP